MSVLFRCTVPGYQLIPAVRTTRRAKHVNDRAIAYGKQQVELANLFIIEALSQKVECPISVPVAVDIVVHYTDGIKRDGDNIYKSVTDALVKSGVLKDDNVALVPKGAFRVRLRKKSASFTVQLKEV